MSINKFMKKEQKSNMKVQEKMHHEPIDVPTVISSLKHTIRIIKKLTVLILGLLLCILSFYTTFHGYSTWLISIPLFLFGAFCISHISSYYIVKLTLPSIKKLNKHERETAYDLSSLIICMIGILFLFTNTLSPSLFVAILIIYTGIQESLNKFE